MDPRFNELLQVRGRLRDARVLGLRRSPQESGAQIPVYANRGELSEGVARELDFFYRTLKLDPEARDARRGDIDSMTMSRSIDYSFLSNTIGSTREAR